jgi:hypothetical protein
MATDTFNGLANQVPTFPVSDGTNGTLDNLKSCLYINMWLLGPSAKTGVFVPGIKLLNVKEDDPTTLEAFAGTQRQERVIHPRSFLGTFTRAQFIMTPLKEIIRHSYAMKAGADIRLARLTCGVKIQFALYDETFTNKLDTEVWRYDECTFTGLDNQFIPAADGYATEQITFLTQDETIMIMGGLQCATQPAAQGTYAKVG